MENKVNQDKAFSSGIATPSKGLAASAAPRTAPKTTTNALRPRTAQTCSKMDRVPFSQLSSASTASSASLSFSLNSSTSEKRDLTRSAKLSGTLDRAQKVQALKEKWAADRARKASQFKERRKQELRRIAEDNAQAAEQRRRQLDRQRECEEREKQAKHEQLASSLQARAQLAADLEKQNKAKRRISMFLNSSMRKRAQEKEAQLAAQRKQQEIELLASRRLDFLETREAKREEEQRRRESLHNRILSAAEERERLAQVEAQRKSEEKALLEMRQSNWQDDHSVKLERERSRRESLAMRGEMWRMQQEKEEELQRERQEAERSLIVSREQGWKDVQQHQKKVEKSRRESLAGRLDKWRAERAQAEKQQVDSVLVEQMERELTEQAHKDVKEYEESIKESRRQSLAYRLDKAKKDKDFEVGQQALQQMVNEELRRIEEQDRQDVHNYRQRILESRRQSLQYRALTENQERMRLEGERQAQMAADAEDRDLRAQAWEDVKAYNEKQRAEQRHSLAWRLADAHRQKEFDLEQHEENLSKLHLDFLCKREDWLAVQNYKKNEQELRRKSVSMRLESWRAQKMVAIKEQERLDLIKEEEAMFREMDREALMYAQFSQTAEQRKDLISGGMTF